ncbi:hypothetical protein CDAR_52351 [Caerostris darwini]|uniref:Uncharacterized protein n=1 Tax=Caerostris darwini TaxID=1538125 RepID=A0AAV4QMA3_9ARAC|nr:hypothetical protein CDAR_52351 [Caerostris darwini]
MTDSQIKSIVKAFRTHATKTTVSNFKIKLPLSRKENNLRSSPREASSPRSWVSAVTLERGQIERQVNRYTRYGMEDAPLISRLVRSPYKRRPGLLRSLLTSATTVKFKIRSSSPSSLSLTEDLTRTRSFDSAEERSRFFLLLLVFSLDFIISRIFGL